MTKTLVLVSLWFIGIWTETLGHRDYIRPYSYSIPSENSKSVGQNGIGVSYGKLSSYMYRDSGDYGQEIEEARPLCEEERKSLSIRELIQSKSSIFLQTNNNLDMKKYNLIPRKVDIIKCVYTSSEENFGAMCKPENCRERKVDIEVFGRQKNETENSWEFIGTLLAVPVACECFLQWKPQKCSKPSGIFTDF